MHIFNSPPIYRVKNVQKEGVFACDYAKTPQKESKKIVFSRYFNYKEMESPSLSKWTCHSFPNSLANCSGLSV